MSDPASRRVWPWGLALSVAVLIVYLANGDILVGNDAKPSTLLAGKLLYRGEMTFTPQGEPYMFHWGMRTSGELRPETVEDWDQPIEGQSALDHARAGRLVLLQPKYYLVPATNRGHYVSFYGPGTAIAALPVYAARSIIQGNLLNRPERLWYTAKWVASLYTAGSVFFIFATACSFLSRPLSLFVAGAYGIGTCVWSTSSQALWQHGPAAFFVALGMYFLHRTSERPRFGAWCGLALACAVACRPTSAILVLAVGLHLLLDDRRTLVRYVMAGLPVALALGIYNATYLGSPFTFGQSMQSAFTQTFSGNDDVWQTPFWTGLTGILFSPSRGLLVYSPYLALAAWGSWKCARDPRYAFLRPAALATAVTILILSRFHGWWGGWSFGYRELVDTAPLLALLTIPVILGVVRHRWIRYVHAILVVWSVYVQVLGAFAYNVHGWNSLDGRNVDLAEHRSRLWSVQDGQIAYYTNNFAQARAVKKKMIRQWIDHPGR